MTCAILVGRSLCPLSSCFSLEAFHCPLPAPEPELCSLLNIHGVLTANSRFPLTHNPKAPKPALHPPRAPFHGSVCTPAFLHRDLPPLFPWEAFQFSPSSPGPPASPECVFSLSCSLVLYGAFTTCPILLGAGLPMLPQFCPQPMRQLPSHSSQAETQVRALGRNIPEGS